MVEREDIIDFKLNVDPKMKDDTVIEHENGKDFTYNDIKNAFPLRKQDPITCLVYWDDICQFTSIGLIEFINKVIETNAKVDLEHFLYRPNEYSYGIKYAQKIFEKVLTPEQVTEIKKKFYWEIMTSSLKTELFSALIRIDTYFDRLGFYFPYKFKNADNLKKDLKNIFFRNYTEEKLFFYYGSDGMSFNEILKSNMYNSVITPSITDTYEYIIDNNLKKISIIGPDRHNGLTDELYDMFAKYSNFPRPNDCKISLFEEFPSL